MNIYEYFKDVNSKADAINKKAKNPFVDYDYSTNPFRGAFKQTYIWIEKETNKKEDIN